MIITGDKEFYKGVSKINYEGKESDNPFAYKYYNPDQLVMGKTMREHFKFAIAYWHSFCGQGADPFGPCLLYTSPSPRDGLLSRMPSSA